MNRFEASHEHAGILGEAYMLSVYKAVCANQMHVH